MPQVKDLREKNWPSGKKIRSKEREKERKREKDILLRSEIFVDLDFGLSRKPLLPFVVPIPKVMTLARRLERKAQRVVGRVRAVVRPLVEAGRVAGHVLLDELLESQAEEVLIYDDILWSGQ